MTDGEMTEIEIEIAGDSQRDGDCERLRRKL